MTNTVTLSDQQVAEFRQYVNNRSKPMLIRFIEIYVPGKYAISGNQTNSASAFNSLAMFYLEWDYRLDEAFALAKRAVKFKPISSYWDAFAYSLYKNRNMKKQTKQLKST